MAKQQTEYVRVAGQERWPSALFGASQRGLWSAPDHLLYIEKENCGETYRRFRLRHIQAVLVERTNRATVTTAVFATLTGLALLWLFHGGNAGWEVGRLVVSAGLAAALSLVLVVNILRGPTCATYVRTAVQTQQVWSVSRLRAARQVVAHVRNIIEAAQGGAFTEDLVEKMRANVARQEEEATKIEAQRAAAGPATPARALKPYKGSVHKVLFSLLLADFYHNCLQFHFTHPKLHLVAMTLGIGILVSAVTAVIRQFRTTLWLGIKVVTWATVPYLVMLAVLSNLFLVFSGWPGSLGAQGSRWLYESIYATSPFDSWLRMAMVIFGIVGSGGLGLAGLLMFNKFKRQETAMAPEPTAAQERAE
ncbi:hypothetical protein ACFLQU_05205 [Verrucomicrobiota bacterium]